MNSLINTALFKIAVIITGTVSLIATFFNIHSLMMVLIPYVILSILFAIAYMRKKVYSINQNERILNVVTFLFSLYGFFISSLALLLIIFIIRLIKK